MDKKLTLSLNEDVIENAKLYAKKHQISLSKLIEGYLQSVSKNQSKGIEVTPLVKTLSGVIELPTDLDIRAEYASYLINKYQGLSQYRRTQ